MLGNMACHHNHVADNRTESATMYLMACFSSANGFLSNHPQDIVGKNGQFKHHYSSLVSNFPEGSRSTSISVLISL